MLVVSQQEGSSLHVLTDYCGFLSLLKNMNVKLIGDF